MSSWRQSRDYRIWRVRVIGRDKVCQICGSIKNRHAHHLNHATYFPEQRFDVNNGICLCSNCHKIFHTSYKRSYRVKCTREDFIQFIELYTRSKKYNICEKLDIDKLQNLSNKLSDS